MSLTCSILKKKINSFFTLVWTKYIFLPKVMVPTVHLVNVLRSPARRHVATSKKGGMMCVVDS